VNNNSRKLATKYHGGGGEKTVVQCLVRVKKKEEKDGKIVDMVTFS